MITNDRSDVHGKNENQRSKVKVTEVKIQFRPFPDRNSSLNSLIDFEIMHKASRSIEKVPYYFFRSSIEFQGHILFPQARPHLPCSQSDWWIGIQQWKYSTALW